MTSENKRIALQRHRERAGSVPVEVVVADGDLVTVVHQGDGDCFAFHTYRITDGRVVEEWSNGVTGEPAAGGRSPAQPGRGPAPIGAGPPSANTRRVVDFYRCVFDAHNPDAVEDFVHEEYLQHSRHLPSGRAGLRGFVAEAFPDGPIPTPDEPSLPPSILMGEGDLVVIAAAVPQPDGHGGTVLRYLYDAYRVREGFLCEHWSGVDPRHPPVMP